MTFSKANKIPEPARRTTHESLVIGGGVIEGVRNDANTERAAPTRRNKKEM